VRRAAAWLSAFALFFPHAARAQDLREELDVQADQVNVDVRMRELELRGHVHADAPPFHLSADALTIHRSSHGIIVDGDGRLTFCPCLGTPLALGFKSVTVAPPGDLFVTSPRLEIFHIPVFWLPWFWLRAPSRVGLLPPEIAWRGADGLFIGEGVHLPWRARDGSQVTFDLRGGGYVQGGFAVDASIRTDATSTRVRLDHLSGDGLLVDARGALAHDVARVAWDFDLLRGARGVLSTTELDPAARPFDVGSAEASLAWPSSFIVASGVRMAALRGGDLIAADAAGPYVTIAHDAALGHVGTYDATIDGSVLHETAMGSVALAHGEVGMLLAGHASWVGLRASLRGVADAASDATETGAIAAALGRVEATLPLVRSYGTSADALRHRIEPFVAVSGLASDATGALPDLAARSMALMSQTAIQAASGEALVASAGLRTALARWAHGDGLEVEANAGGVVDSTGSARGAVRWRVLAGGSVLGLSGEGAHVFADGSTGNGDVVVLRARVGGGPDRPMVAGHVAARDGVDPVTARLLTDSPLEPAAGLLALPGYSAGVRASVPWARWLTTRGGVEMDLSAVVVTAATGSIELRDKCGCFRLRLNASHRLGRDGVDVWATIDLAPH
jgi:hypothetical protein